METPARITNQCELQALWAGLMGPWGFATTSLWFVLLDAQGRPVRSLTEVADCDRLPMRAQLEPLTDGIAALIEPGESLGFLLSRPGSGGLSQFDQVWAEKTLLTARNRGLQVWPFCIATQGSVRVVPDDVAASA